MKPCRLLMRRLPSYRLFVLLSLTWGLPLTLLGGIIFAGLMVVGYRPKRFGYCYYIEIGERWGGLELGLFFLKDKTPSIAIMAHEHGHGLQNCCYGIFMPLIVTLPSAARYWYRRICARLGYGNRLPPYHSIWFEAEADRLGSFVLESQK